MKDFTKCHFDCIIENTLHERTLIVQFLRKGFSMTNKEKGLHIRKAPPILPRIVILLFLIMILLFVNIDSFSHLLNYNCYERATATVVKPETDVFLLLIPMVQIQYQYDGKEYTEDKFFVLQPLFGLSREPGQQLDIYVNTNAPNYCLFQVNFFRNIVNWILLALIGICIYNMVRRIQKKREVKHEK